MNCARHVCFGRTHSEIPRTLPLNSMAETLGYDIVGVSNDRHRRLLRLRRERPSRHTAKKGNEIAPLTSSNFDACTTGKSAGLMPLRMRAV